MKTAMYIYPKEHISFSAELPFILKWAERYITLSMKTQKIEKTRGQEFNMVIIDDVSAKA